VNCCPLLLLGAMGAGTPLMRSGPMAPLGSTRLQ
jgi:hypothetical protein